MLFADTNEDRGWVHCADDGQRCACQGKAVYGRRCGPMGASGHCRGSARATIQQMLATSAKTGPTPFVMTLKPVSGGIQCSSAAFGRDPVFGYTKQCHCQKGAVRCLPEVGDRESVRASPTKPAHPACPFVHAHCKPYPQDLSAHAYSHTHTHTHTHKHVAPHALTPRPRPPHYRVCTR